MEAVDWREVLKPQVKANHQVGGSKCRLYLSVDGRPVASGLEWSKSIVTTALQKAVRRGDWRRAALYAWALSQCDGWYFWRRMRIIALEDLNNPLAFNAMYGLRREWEAECEPYRKRKEPCVSWDGLRIAVAAAVWLASGAPCGGFKDRRADSFMELVNTAGRLALQGVETEAWRMVVELANVPSDWLDVHIVKSKGERSWVLEGSETEEGRESTEYAVWKKEWRRMMREVYEKLGTW